MASADGPCCWAGGYEPETQKRMMREVRRASVFHDIGAKAGFYSLLAASLCDPGPVYAFEPLAANRELLMRHLELNRVSNVEVVPLALTGEMEKNGRPNDSPAGQDGEGATLDVLLREGRLAPPHCLRVDMQGAELRCCKAHANVSRSAGQRFFSWRMKTKSTKGAASFWNPGITTAKT